MPRRRRTTTLFLTILLASGCGKAPPPIVPVEGVVLLNGAPLPKAKIRFVPKIDRASEFMAQAVTDEQGRFVLMCRGKPGACAIESLVTVSEDDIPARLTPESARAELQVYLKSLANRPIPPQYGNLAENPLEVTVAVGQKEYTIELTR